MRKSSVGTIHINDGFQTGENEESEGLRPYQP